MRWLIILILLSTIATAQTIADYPNFLLGQNFYLIKGDARNVQEIAAANTIAINLPITQYQVARSTKFAAGVKILDRPAILIGTPCRNYWIAKVLNLAKCNVIPPTDGIVAVVNYYEQPIIVVTGGSPAAVFGAAQWLARGENKAYYGNIVRIIRTGGYSRVYIGNGDLLQIGQPIGQVTPVITIGSQKYKGTSANEYLIFPSGKVIFGKNKQ